MIAAPLEWVAAVVPLTPLVTPVNSKLLKGGVLIFSDIILTEQCNHDEIREVYDRVGITNLETHYSYVKFGADNGLKYVNSLEYKTSMLHHYKNIRDVVYKTNENKKIIEGLDSWIKHIELNNITTKLFIYIKT